MDDARLKQANRFGKGYFVELLERIGKIRASARRLLMALPFCSTDFWQTGENGLIWPGDRK